MSEPSTLHSTTKTNVSSSPHRRKQSKNTTLVNELEHRHREPTAQQRPAILEQLNLLRDGTTSRLMPNDACHPPHALYLDRTSMDRVIRREPVEPH